MPETEKDDSDNQLGEEKKERCACDVQNPFVTRKISVRRTTVNDVA